MGPVDEFKAIKARVTECLHLASAHFGETFPEIPVKFDLTGSVGGYFCWRQCRTTGKVTQYFRFNRVLVRENLDEYLEQICPHEVAHYIARSKWGLEIKPHGAEWKSVMVNVFNLAPDRCHSMDTTSVEKLPFVYRCACQEHRVSKRKHNRIRRGGIYTCNHNRVSDSGLRRAPSVPDGRWKPRWGADRIRRTLSAALQKCLCNFPRQSQRNVRADTARQGLTLHTRPHRNAMGFFLLTEKGTGSEGKKINTYA